MLHCCLTSPHCCAEERGGKKWPGNPHPDGPDHDVPYLGWVNESSFFKDVPDSKDPEAPQPTLELFAERQKALAALNLTWDDYWPPAKDA